ncbi:hypothetical protein [Paenibacillus sp. IHBB 3054]|uniref:hypothetical protein n=1 Tax=Paenibacillus sp. IHBB 3054 TaxID=3425689 RepID=UPI003F67A3D0
MTQTPSRDWQKDMALVQGTIKHDAFPAWTEPMLFWLQAYAAEANEVCYWKGEAESEKARADTAEELAVQYKEERDSGDEARAEVYGRLLEAEGREQQLKEESSEAVEGLYQIVQRGDLTSFDLDQANQFRIQYISTLYPDTPAPTPEIKQPAAARPINEWYEELSDVLWWKFPIEEPPYCGTPLDADWPDYCTHWTPLVIPAAPASMEG